MSDFRIDLADQRLWHGNQPVSLTGKAFSLLCLFIENENRLLTKDQILDAVWGEVNVSESLVREYVHDLRTALGDDPHEARFIETVRGRGYRYLGGIVTFDAQADDQSNRTAANSIPTLAVLPFRNLSSGAGIDYFSDGLTEDIVTGLSKIPHLSVIAHGSRPGKEPSARFVLQGAVRRTGKHVRVTAHLVDAETDRNLWAEQYDREHKDVLAMQDEIVGSIVHALGAQDGVLEKYERQRSVETQSSSQTAYDLYLRGRSRFDRHLGNFEEAESLFEKAIAADPGFAPAYSALAYLYFVRFKLIRTASFDDIHERARDLALEAIRLDQNEYRAHWVLAFLDTHMGLHAQGLAQFERALNINPNDANVLVWSAEALVYTGRASEALQRCQRAMRLNPKCPNFYYWNLGFAYFHQERYDEALAALEQMTTPEHAGRLLAATYAHLDRMEEARATAREYLKLDPGFSISTWARTEHYADPGELQRFVDGLRKAGFPD
jgi:adenylate cyclase